MSKRAGWGRGGEQGQGGSAARTKLVAMVEQVPKPGRLHPGKQQAAEEASQMNPTLVSGFGRQRKTHEHGIDFSIWG